MFPSEAPRPNAVHTDDSFPSETGRSFSGPADQARLGVSRDRTLETTDKAATIDA